MDDIDFNVLPEITSPKLFLDSKHSLIDQQGILSEVIFGPTKNYRCACGAYNNKTIYGGKTCPKCNVACDSNSIRYRTFAKIKCLFPIIKTSKKNKFNKLTKREFNHLINPEQSDLSTSVICYLRYNQKRDEISITDQFDEKCIPLAITGIFTLYIGLMVIQIYYNSANSSELLNYFLHDILVIPPNTRSTIVNEEFHSTKGILKSDIDEIYINILGYKKSHLKYFNGDYEQYIAMVLTSMNIDIDTRFPIIDDQLSLFDSLTASYQYHYNMLYLKISDLLSGKKGYIRDQHMSKRIDFSARSVVVTDASLDTYQIKIPIANFVKLYFIEYLTYLYKIKHCEFSFIKQIINKSEEALHLWKELSYIYDFMDWWFANSRTQDNLVLLGRNPTLWKHGLVGCEIIGLNNLSKTVISVSPMIVSALNMDHDGDTAAIYRVHDENSKLELMNKAFLKNTIKFDHCNSYLHTIMADSVYCIKLLSSYDYDLSRNFIHIDRIEDLPFKYELVQALDTPVKFNSEIYPYGQVLLNKLAYQTEILINQNSSMDDISDYIFKVSHSNEDYHTKLCQMNRHLNWILNIQETRTLTLPVKQSCEVLQQTNKNHLINKLPENPQVGVYIYEKILNETFANIDPKSNFSLLSKTKFKRAQISRSVITIGYIADAENIIQSIPINSNLLRGLDEDSFFKCGVGTRKGLNDKQNLTPDSGYLARTMSIACSPVELIEDDCNCHDGFKITIINKKHANSLKNRYVKLHNDWVLFHPEDHYVGKELEFRSPITCQTKDYKICKKCFGEYDIQSPFVGTIAGQVINHIVTCISNNTVKFF